MRRQVVELNHLSDSLLTAIDSKDRYLQNIKLIVDGKTPSEIEDLISVEKSAIENVVFETISEDSVLRKQIEEEERFSLFASANNNTQSVDNVLFFAPIKGVVTQSFNPKTATFRCRCCCSRKRSY